MALLLEFSDYLYTGERQQRGRSNSQAATKFEAGVAELIRVLEMTDVTPMLESLDPQNGKFKLIFTLKAEGNLSAIFRLNFDQKMKGTEVSVNILQRGSHCQIRSSEIIKNICRTIKSINAMATRYPTFFVVGPTTRHLLLKTQITLPSERGISAIFPFLKALLMETSNFLKTFFPIILYSCNLLPRTSLESQLSVSLKNVFFGVHGEFNRYAEIYELLPLINCPLEMENEGRSDKEKEDNMQKNANPKRIIQLFYDQKYSSQKKEVALYCEPAEYIPDSPLNSFQKDAQMLSFPTLKEQSMDHPFIFNTITVIAHDRKREQFFSQGGKARIHACPIRFIYSKSMDVTYKQPKPKKEDVDDESTEETDDVAAKNGIEMERVMLVKMPRVHPKDKEWKRQLDQITYQKEVLSNLRTVGCAYIPKYYHSIQEKYEYRPFLLMDRVNGATLQEQLQRRPETLTHSAKLHILTHLSNALRFLQAHGIAHLDLSPNNIMVVKDYLIKLVDFGEAYHRTTSKKYSPTATREQGRFVYSPGRTFPYAPPQTSSRLQNFSSQQDMYSLGIIMHLLVFGSFPFTCSQETHKQLYRDRMYPDRIMVAPERVQFYGQFQFVTVLLNLILKLLDCEEKRRPLPVWTFIIIKKLFYTIR